MKYEKFKIVNLVKDLIIAIDKNLVNFPKKEIELKQEIKKSAYELLAIVYEAKQKRRFTRKGNCKIKIHRFLNKCLL